MSGEIFALTVEQSFEQAIPYIVALGGGAGIGAGLKAAFDAVLALRAGVSAREGKRRADIVGQRDAALALVDEYRRLIASADLRAERERVRADWAESNMQVERSNEQHAREHASELRSLLLEARDRPLRRDELPVWPVMEQTVPRAVFESAQRRVSDE